MKNTVGCLIEQKNNRTENELIKNRRADNSLRGLIHSCLLFARRYLSINYDVKIKNDSTRYALKLKFMSISLYRPILLLSRMIFLIYRQLSGNIFGEMRFDGRIFPAFSDF